MTHNYCLGTKYFIWFTVLCTTTVQINLVNAKMNGLTVPSPWFTGKSLSEALIFESTNPQYDNRLFSALQVEYMKIPSSKLGRTCCVQKLFLTFRTFFYTKCSPQVLHKEELLTKIYLYNQWFYAIHCYHTRLNLKKWVFSNFAFQHC